MLCLWTLKSCLHSSHEESVAGEQKYPIERESCFLESHVGASGACDAYTRSSTKIPVL